ncbi:MAG: sodium:calcium antiporter [Parcubacteria group bacterium]|nr:sodium:calcium antiporter [Parcubacteria group bacterium]
MLFPFFVFMLSLALTVWAGGILPRALGGIALILRLSQFVTAFFLVSLATSIPELFIGISSAFQNIPDISLGNILGGNLVNITLKVGIIVLIVGALTGEGKISNQNFWLVFFLGVLPTLLGVDGVISRGDGVILLLAFALYIIKIFKDEEYYHKHIPIHEPPDLRSVSNVMRHFGVFLGGSVLLLVSSFLLIWSSKEIVGAYFDENFFLFGIIFLALGTTIPEFIFGVRASRMGQGAAMLGNTLGSIAYNATAIVGLVAVLNPIEIDSNGNFFVIAFFLFVAFLMFHFFVYTKRKITRLEASVLLLVYILFLGLTIPECIKCVLN